MFSFELQRRARVYVVGRKGRNALYVTFAIYVQGAKRTSCNNEFKYFVVFDTIFLKRNECFDVSNSSWNFPANSSPFYKQSAAGFFKAGGGFFLGPSKEEAELGAKWGEGTDCFVSCACEVGKSTGVCRGGGGVAVTTLGLADRTLEEKEKNDFPSWYRVTHPPDENGMLKQIVGPKKKV